ncbi:hypothetical protein P5673_032338 [Acropora cervicornis]|uniref:CCHC-type domain-containing protein n=1 Tax=Acropora cervicornis TaxID=6130 RepID=A0AAD9PRN4_ACRCE|nr:hypothetical protein P5673_032338 [Acropora cervicornis]
MLRSLLDKNGYRLIGSSNLGQYVSMALIQEIEQIKKELEMPGQVGFIRDISVILDELYLYVCEVLKTLEKRRQMFNEKKLCYNCGREGHGANYCLCDTPSCSASRVVHLKVAVEEFQRKLNSFIARGKSPRHIIADNA